MPRGGDTDKSDGPTPEDAALAWSGKTRSARPARMDKPLRCRPLEGRRDQRSPLRRCFKPRPPLSAGCAGFASGCRLSGSELKRSRISHEKLGVCSGRLSGLLSGCPPTDTRPQARAKLGGRDISALATRCKSFLLLRGFFSRVRGEMVTQALRQRARAVASEQTQSAHRARSSYVRQSRPCLSTMPNRHSIGA